jgi:hypothetical protein
MLDRHDAGVVLKAGFHKRIERPKCTPDNGKIRSTIPCNLLSCDLFQEVLGSKDVGQKFIGGLLGNFQMSITMACHFVTICPDLLDDLGKAFGKLAENKQRSSHLHFS